MKAKIDALAGLMDEFKLSEAEMATDGFRIAFKKRSKVLVAPSNVMQSEGSAFVDEHEEEPPIQAPVDSRPTGTPVTSPMTGIYYSAPNPGSAPFVKIGDEVAAGQVIGLIEAMKVFNEIPAPTSGTVTKMIIETGQLVNFGDPLLYLG